jgi:hypothetical protein
MVPFTIEPLADAFARALTRAAGRPLETRSLPLLVERVSRKYLGERESLAKADELAARALFFLPRDLHKVVAPLGELSRVGALPDRPLRVLDVGAGVGASALGATMALERLGHAIACVHAADEDRDALAMLERVWASARDEGLLPARSAITTRPGRADAPASLRDVAGAGWDVILVSNVLTEVLREEDRRAAGPRDEAARAARIAELVEGIVRHAPLSPDGALVLVEPATRDQARALQRAREELAARGLTVFAPCTHAGACPMLARERDWCHEDLEVDLPPWLRDIARGAGLRYQGLTYAYLTVRLEAGRVGLRGAPAGWVSARLVSAVRDTKGKREAFLCAPSPAAGDEAHEAPEPLRAMQLDRAVKGAPEDTPRLGACVRGELLAVDPAVLPGPDEGRTVRLGLRDWSREGEGPLPDE